ncbi:MAG: SprT family zinc-dependent metalloprotease [Pseudomonadota bacterium]
MTETLTVGSPPITVAVRRSARARRLTLRVSSVDGAAVLTVPARVGRRTVDAFLDERTAWLREAQTRAPAPVVVGPGSNLPIEGRMCVITRSAGGPLRLEGDRLHVPGQEARVGARVLAWIKHGARDRVAAAADHHAARIGRSVSRITLRDTRSRWGSCTTEGNIMLSWRLFLAPPEILDYVVAHEVAHLEEMNHAPAFWRIVRELCPDYESHRGWLHSHGAELHRYRFAPL